MQYGRDFLLVVPEVDCVVGRDRHQRSLVNEKLDLDDRTGGFAFVTDVRVDAGLTQSGKAVNEAKVKNHFLWQSRIFLAGRAGWKWDWN